MKKHFMETPVQEIHENTEFPVQEIQFPFHGNCTEIGAYLLGKGINEMIALVIY